MSVDEPRRLFDSPDVSALLRGALDAERADAVPDARLARIGQALALAEASAPPPNVPTAPRPADPPTGWVASKGPFVLLAAAVVGGLLAIGQVNPTPPKPRTEPAPVATVAASPVENATPEAPSTPGISLADLPTAPVASGATSAPPKVTRPAAATPSADEIALLARAHDALSGDPARSLALCKEHEGRFAGGHFAQEREAVAIEALVYLGRKAEARRRWDDFQRRYPSSSHRVHLQSLLATP